tara:strand:+ start:105 stop:209 length:105 start_codon:yes stop_codon:yes gene_type:complete
VLHEQEGQSREMVLVVQTLAMEDFAAPQAALASL